MGPVQRFTHALPATIEPLAQADGHSLSLWPAFLLAVCPRLRVSVVIGFPIRADCLILQDGLSQVLLRPGPASMGNRVLWLVFGPSLSMRFHRLWGLMWGG